MFKSLNLSNYRGTAKWLIFSCSLAITFSYIATARAKTPTLSKEQINQNTSAAVITNQKKEKIKIGNQELEGYQVVFDYQNYPKERKIALEYFLQEYKGNDTFSKLQLQNIGIDFYDIDNNGLQEIIAYANLGEKCPRAGCPLAILKVIKTEFNKTQYEVIGLGREGGSNLMTDTIPILLDSTTLGYHDILFGGRESLLHSIWKWNGKYYN